jgi:hypothetical protein
MSSCRSDQINYVNVLLLSIALLLLFRQREKRLLACLTPDVLKKNPLIPKRNFSFLPFSFLILCMLNRMLREFNVLMEFYFWFIQPHCGD